MKKFLQCHKSKKNKNFLKYILQKYDYENVSIRVYSKDIVIVYRYLKFLHHIGNLKGTS